MQKIGQSLNAKAPKQIVAGAQYFQSRMKILDIILMNITIAFFILFSLSQYITPTISNIRWIALGAWSGLLIIRILHKRKKLILRMPLSGKIAAIMLTWFIITIFLSSDSLSISLQKYSAVLWLYLIGYFLFPTIYYNTNFKTTFVVCLSVQFALFLIYGFWINIISDLYSVGFQRFYGLYARPLMPALMASSLLIISISFIFFKSKKNRKLAIIISVALGIFSVATIYATGTRTALLSTAIIVVAWAFIHFKKYRSIIAIVCLLLFAFQGRAILKWYETQQVYERPTNLGILTGRMDRYRIQINTFLDKPITGTGFASDAYFAYDIDTRAMSHSAYLGAFVETGILGGLLFLCWIGVSLYEVFRDARDRLNKWVDQYKFMFVGIIAISSTVESFLMMAGNILILAYYVLIGMSSRRVSRLDRINTGIISIR